MAKRILVLSTKPQYRGFDRGLIEYLKRNPALGMDGVTDMEFEYCSDLKALPFALSGSKTPEDKETWRVPGAIIYTGEMRLFDGTYNWTVNVPFGDMIRKYGIEKSIKIEPEFFELEGSKKRTDVKEIES